MFLVFNIPGLLPVSVLQCRIHDLKSRRVSKYFQLRSNKSQAHFDPERESDKMTRHLLNRGMALTQK